jgi:hypothetical protein
MGYIQRSLADGERIVYRTKLHPVIFVWPLLFLLLTYAAFTRGFDVMRQVFLALTLLTGFWASMYWFSEFIVTNRRVLGRIPPGRWLNALPDYVEVSLIEVRAVEFKPGLLGRLFDCGTVVVTDAQGVRHKFPGVPAEFYEHVQARDERARRALN